MTDAKNVCWKKTVFNTLQWHTLIGPSLPSCIDRREKVEQITRSLVSNNFV